MYQFASRIIQKYYYMYDLKNRKIMSRKEMHVLHDISSNWTYRTSLSIRNICLSYSFSLSTWPEFRGVTPILTYNKSHISCQRITNICTQRRDNPSSRSIISGLERAFTTASNPHTRAWHVFSSTAVKIIGEVPRIPPISSIVWFDNRC